MQEKKEIKDVEECTFKPNSSLQTRSKSHHYLRNPRQFLQDQAKKEQNRLQRITQQMELNDLKQTQELKFTPQINMKSRRLVEKKGSLES